MGRAATARRHRAAARPEELRQQRVDETRLRSSDSGPGLAAGNATSPPAATGWTTSAAPAAAVRMRDVPGALGHRHGLGRDARTERLAGVGEAAVLRQAFPDDLAG